MGHWLDFYVLPRYYENRSKLKLTPPLPLPGSLIPHQWTSLLRRPYDRPVYLATLSRTLCSPASFLNANSITKFSLRSTSWVPPVLLCLNLGSHFDHRFPVVPGTDSIPYSEGQATCSVKDQTMNSSGISVSTTWHCSTKAAMNNT